MWGVEEDRFRREVGNDEFNRLKELRTWLYPGQTGGMKFRSAPSLVARSEAELFDISMPRFAFRAYLTDDEESFVNARRIETFAQMADKWGEPPAGQLVDWERLYDAKTSPAGLIRARRPSCIGDSLLKPPEKIDEVREYHVLQAELGLAYGEHKEIRGVPFVRHIRLGGGMCGQAACFMATALLQHEARGIYGVAEITALASGQDGPAITISGISADGICNYFNHREVGLSASRQYVQQVDEDEPALVRELGEALSAYSMSNVPVILRVDLGRMCGIEYRAASGDKPLKDDHLFMRNGLASLKAVEKCREEGVKEPKPRPHAVVVVGCQAKRSGAGCAAEPLHFLINDPATYPFLRADARVLANIRQYDATRWQKRKLGFFEFISVTPQAVRLPLLNVPNPRNRDNPHMGLKDIAFRVLANPVVPNLERLGHAAIPTDRGVETRLVDLRPPEGQGAKDGDSWLEERAARLPEGAKEGLLELLRRGKLPPKWCWIHYGHSHLVGGREVESVFVWDATVPPPPQGAEAVQLMEKYLLAALTRDSTQQGAAWTKGYTCPKAIKPALITSFHTGAMPDVRIAWPADPIPATDLYVFMKLEVDQWLKNNPRFSGPPDGPKHPVAVMERLADNREAIDKWTADAYTSFPPGKPEEIVALSSFVPEVTSPQPDTYEKACRAVRFLVEFAYALKRLGHKRLRTIELVMGSRIGGIWPLPGDSYAATKMNAAEARHRMLSALARAVAPYANLASDDRVALGIELEPGPLYLLHNWQSLVETCRHIDKDPLLSRFVGVNLDIAHWRLARDIAPAQVWDTPEVRNRIVHAHISDHHRCMHGDLPLYDANAAEDFRPWIELLHRIASDWRTPDLPQFSGYVSVELEAAKDKQVVVQSIQQLERLL